jgi:purine-binding chemotaxis protein CheW
VRALLLPLGDEWRALDVSRVREVVSEPRPTGLPAGPDAVFGVFNLRGEILPLFDVAVLLGLPPTEPMAFAVVVETGAGSAGLAASALPETRELERQIEGGEAEQVDWRVDDRLVRLLDLDILLGVARAPGSERAA